MYTGTMSLTDFDLGLKPDVGRAPRGEVLDVHDVSRRLDGVRLVPAIRVEQGGVGGAAVADLDALGAASDVKVNCEIRN